MKQTTKDWIYTIITALIIAFCVFFYVPTTRAQNVQRVGNCFVQQSNAKPDAKDVKTKYTYKAADGKIYPIYLSKNNKAYIIRVSKKTGREYRQYLPNVTEQIKGSTKS